MLASLLNATLRILFFRAGPQDLPYEPKLTAPLALAAALATGLQMMPVLALPAAIAAAIATVAVLGATTRLVLRMRQLEARFHQTFAALLATSALLTLLIVPFFMQLAPALVELAGNPALLEHPEQMSTPLPVGAAFVITAVSLWNFFVNASIFRHALNSSFGVGLLVATVLSVLLQLFASFAAGLFGGAGS